MFVALSCSRLLFAFGVHAIATAEMAMLYKSTQDSHYKWYTGDRNTRLKQGTSQSTAGEPLVLNHNTLISWRI